MPEEVSPLLTLPSSLACTAGGVTAELRCRAGVGLLRCRAGVGVAASSTSIEHSLGLLSTEMSLLDSLSSRPWLLLFSLPPSLSSFSSSWPGFLPLPGSGWGSRSGSSLGRPEWMSAVPRA